MPSSEFKNLQLVSNLFVRYMYSSDHDMGIASEMGLELCQVLDIVKLMLRASYMMNKGLNMKRRIRMKSSQYHNRKNDDSKMNLMVCIYIYIFIY